MNNSNKSSSFDKHKHNLNTARTIVINHILKRIQTIDGSSEKGIKELNMLYKQLKQLTGDECWSMASND